MQGGAPDAVRQLSVLLVMCTIPSNRLDLSKPSNIRWLRRHLSPRNCPLALLGTVNRLLTEVGRGL